MTRTLERNQISSTSSPILAIGKLRLHRETLRHLAGGNRRDQTDDTDVCGSNSGSSATLGSFCGTCAKHCTHNCTHKC